MQIAESLRPTLLRLAAEMARASLRGERYVPPADPEPALVQPAGCFVSLHDRQTHHLRGCIGCMDASRPLLESLIGAARSVLDDPRFTGFPVTLAEFSQLEIELSIISPLAPAENPLAFDLANDGIYLTIAGRTGCFLPQVARETGWGKEQLLSRLCTEKMGLPTFAWKMPEAQLKTFTTIIVGPVPIEQALQGAS